MSFYGKPVSSSPKIYGVSVFVDSCNPMKYFHRRRVASHVGGNIQAYVVNQSVVEIFFPLHVISH